MRLREAVAVTLALAFTTQTARAVPPAAPPAAPAPEETAADKAGKLRSQGNEAMLGMRYSDALTFYQQAAVLTPDDATLQYNIARAHQLLGDYPEALTALEKFDKQAAPDTKAKVGKLDELYAQMRPRVATLNLLCATPGARVLVGSKVIGTTPLPPTRLGAGAATVQVEFDGFFTEARDVVLPGGGALSLDVELHKKSTSGLVSIKTDPLGANVLVDGQLRGTTTPRIELTLPAGPHEVLAHHEGYDDARVPIILIPGITKDLSIPMSRSVPITARWWFWTGLAVVVAGGVATAILLTTERGADRGTLPPGQVGAP